MANRNTKRTRRIWAKAARNRVKYPPVGAPTSTFIKAYKEARQELR